MTRVAILGGQRTPFAKAGTALKDYSALDLAKLNVTSTVKKLGLKNDQIDELIYSSVLLNPKFPNFAREIVLRTELSNNTSAHFVSNNCISGLVAASFLTDAIKSGRVGLGLAGGVESMSKPSLTLSNQANDFYLKLNYARSFTDKLAVLKDFRLGHLFPLAPSPKEPSTGKTMGQHCEMTAQEFAIKREDQDKWAFASHQKTAAAIEAGIFDGEISEVDGFSKDNIVRGSTSLEKLSRLKPVFDRSAAGTITAGNASALTDGASCICLASENQAQAVGIEPIAYLEDFVFTAISPEDGLLMAPATALTELLAKNNLTVEQVDRFEIHEAFAAQVLSNMLVWEQGWDKIPGLKTFGKIPEEKINVNGGSLALGHPFAATGGRLINSLANDLKRNGLKTGVISICAAGAMAGAVLIKV